MNRAKRFVDFVNELDSSKLAKSRKFGDDGQYWILEARISYDWAWNNDPNATVEAAMEAISKIGRVDTDTISATGHFDDTTNWDSRIPDQKFMSWNYDYDDEDEEEDEDEENDSFLVYSFTGQLWVEFYSEMSREVLNRFISNNETLADIHEGEFILRTEDEWGDEFERVMNKLGM
jgi:hypothetical protein